MKSIWRAFLLGGFWSGLALMSAMPASASLVRSFIYKPEPMPPHPEWSTMPEPETIIVRASDGQILKGYRWPSRTKSHVAIVFFHGNAGNRYAAARMAFPLRRPDAEIIVASYRGYGDNGGEPSEEGLMRDGAAFLAEARASSPTKIYLFGYSLGGAVALKLAAEQRIDGVLTLGAFSSLASVAPPLARLLLPDHFDSLAAITRVTAPILIVHGTADEVVPFAEAEKLKAAAGSKGRLMRLRGAPHHILLDGRGLWDQIALMPPVTTPSSDTGMSADRDPPMASAVPHR